MILWPAITAYIMASILFTRILAGHYAHSWAWREQPTGADWFWATVVAFLVVSIWPAALLWLIGGYRPMGNERIARLHAAEEAARRAQRELEWAERELGIR